MFTELKENLMKLRDKLKDTRVKVKAKLMKQSEAVQVKKPMERPSAHINLITDKVDLSVIDKAQAKAKAIVRSLVKTCTYTEHDCLAYKLTNNLIVMIEMFEKDMKRIETHPSISADTKSDIQHYINKNIITTISALMPAYEIMGKYERAKAFKSIYLKAMSRGAPGIIDEKKYI